MKPTNKSRPVTLIMRAKNPADLKRIADVEEVLSRQVGWGVRLSIILESTSGDEYRSAGWPMRRGDQAAVAMLLRRGKKPNDPPILTVGDIVETNPVAAHAAKGLKKK